MGIIVRNPAFSGVDKALLCGIGKSRCRCLEVLIAVAPGQEDGYEDNESAHLGPSYGAIMAAAR